MMHGIPEPMEKKKGGMSGMMDKMEHMMGMMGEMKAEMARIMKGEDHESEE